MYLFWELLHKKRAREHHRVNGSPNTKDRLVNLNILPTSEATCVLCNDHMESIGHLFFSCNYSWKLWCSCFNKLKIYWVIPIDPRIAFDSWIEVELVKSQRKEWCVCFFSVIWSVWEARNKIIFQKEAFPVEKCLALLWHRWQVWTKEWCWIQSCGSCLTVTVLGANFPPSRLVSYLQHVWLVSLDILLY